jgi:nicotinamide mononucleotide transporter
MTFETFVTGFLGANTIEIAAALSGFVCITLLIKANIWNFAFGFVQVTLYVWVFYGAKLYSDAILHVVYMLLQIYGWWNWSRNMKSGHAVDVISMPNKTLIMWMTLALVSSVLLGFVMASFTDASLPYPDAFTTCVSFVAFILMTQRYVVNWAFWIAVDIVAIGIYFTKGLYPTMILYCCFLIMAVVGLYTWAKKSNDSKTSLSGDRL